MFPPKPPERRVSEEDQALLDRFQLVRDALFHQERQEAERILHQLERDVLERLTAITSQAEAVADAVARSVEIMARQDSLNSQLCQQNNELLDQKTHLEQARQELETQSQRVAEANVDALFLVEASEKKIGVLSSAQKELEQKNLALNATTESLELEANALAMANVEATLLVTEKQETIAELEVQAKQIQHMKDNLEQMVFVDSLTGLFNHRYFKRQIDHELSRCGRYDRALTIIFLDIDQFKAINDEYGHQSGDRVLAKIGSLIAGEIRQADIPIRLNEARFAARYGGEEFVLIMPETQIEGGRIAAERIRQSVESATFTDDSGQPMKTVTISCGVATLVDPAGGVEGLIKRADSALYRAKENGRNRVEIDLELA